MTANGSPAAPPDVLRRLESPQAVALAGLAETFEDLQTVLRCCERLMTEVGAKNSRPATAPDDVLTEAVWTTALLSYARCFRAAEGGAALVEADLEAVLPATEVKDWHAVLMQLRDHYGDPAANPRERFSVGVAQDDAGAATGIALTSARQPLVDELTVRQTGAIAFALSAHVNERIGAQQAELLSTVKDTPRADLDALDRIEVGAPDVAP